MDYSNKRRKVDSFYAAVRLNKAIAIPFVPTELWNLILNLLDPWTLWVSYVMKFYVVFVPCCFIKKFCRNCERDPCPSNLSRSFGIAVYVFSRLNTDTTLLTGQD
jgi:hypothetical protein